MYLTKEAVFATLQEAAKLAAGSTLVMTFLLPIDEIDAEIRPAFKMAERGARASGTPFLSFFTSEEIWALARKAGFREARHVSSSELGRR